MSNPDWENSGPLLRNLPEGAVRSHFWSLLETMVWVATRDERAVAGAAGYLRDHNIVGGKVDLSKAALAVLGPFLRDDVAGHHEDCARMLEDRPCTCAVLGRTRYCKCTPETTRGICGCRDNVFRTMRAALLDGFPVSGKPEGGNAWRGIEPDEMATAHFWYDLTGLCFVPGFTGLSLRIAVVKQRWPADFAELLMLGAAHSRQQAAVDRLGEINIVGRPPDHITGLKLFCDRLDAGLTVSNRMEEGRAIRKIFPANARGGVPQEKSIREWIAPHHRLLSSATDRGSGLANARASALNAIERKVSDKVAAGKR